MVTIRFAIPARVSPVKFQMMLTTGIIDIRENIGGREQR
jgi:hypothetical protein